jgi:hypothetical protein
MVVFRDVLQIEEAEARVVEEWMIRVLTQAPLLESRAKEGKPLRSIFQRGTMKQKYGRPAAIWTRSRLLGDLRRERRHCGFTSPESWLYGHLPKAQIQLNASISASP